MIIIVAQDQSDFLALVVDRYFRVTPRAIKKYDPNHLFLGSRFCGSNLSQLEIFRAAGHWRDVISVNWYHAWTPDPERLAMWEHESGKPVLVTEWSDKCSEFDHDSTRTLNVLGLFQVMVPNSKNASPDPPLHCPFARYI